MALFGKKGTETELKLPEVFPEHVGFIMDGNGRWAKKRNMPRGYGHIVGCDNLEKMCDVIKDMGVNTIMELFRDYIVDVRNFLSENTRMIFLGDKSAFDEDLQQKMIKLEEDTAHYTEMTLMMAVNYGGRDELAHAARILAQKAVNGEIRPEDINEQSVANELYTKGIPDVDLVIRPSGEMRLSNYLIWQCAYAEYYFTDILWPDFTPNELDKALIEFGRRQRRFGGV